MADNIECHTYFTTLCKSVLCIELYTKILNTKYEKTALHLRDKEIKPRAKNQAYQRRLRPLSLNFTPGRGTIASHRCIASYYNEQMRANGMRVGAW